MGTASEQDDDHDERSHDLPFAEPSARLVAFDCCRPWIGARKTARVSVPECTPLFAVVRVLVTLVVVHLPQARARQARRTASQPLARR